MYKMIALDIDGTLLNANQTIMPITKQMLIELQNQDIAVVLSSGRDIESLEKIGKMIDMARYPQSGYICLNGLEIYDSQKQLLYQANKLQKEDAMILSRIARDFQLDVIFFFEQQLYILEYGHTHIIENHFKTFQKDYITNVKNIPQFTDLRKVVYIQQKEKIQEILPTLHQTMDNLFEMTLVEPDWIEINPKGLTKGHALKELAHMKKIPLSQVIAFGNGENDITMLKTAGRGVAMANAFEVVKHNADDICGHYNDDGIGKYLEKIYNKDKICL